MRINRLILPVLLVTLAATQAGAQESATPEQIAEATAHADAVIARSNAGEFFVNVTTTAVPRVRHVPSGMSCAFVGIDDLDKIDFYPQQEGGPAKGEDASCSTWWGTTYISMFATRYPQRYSADELLRSAIGDIYRGWQNVQIVETSYDVRLFGGQPTPLVAVYQGERNGNRRNLALILRNVGDWTFKARGTGQADDSRVVTNASVLFGLAIPGGWEARQK